MCDPSVSVNQELELYKQGLELRVAATTLSLKTPRLDIGL